MDNTKRNEYLHDMDELTYTVIHAITMTNDMCQKWNTPRPIDSIIDNIMEIISTDIDRHTKRDIHVDIDADAIKKALKENNIPAYTSMKENPVHCCDGVRPEDLGIGLSDEQRYIEQLEDELNEAKGELEDLRSRENRVNTILELYDTTKELAVKTAESYDYINDKVNDLIEKQDEFIDFINDLSTFINEYKPSIAVAHKMKEKTDRSGENSYVYRHDVPLDEVVAMYQNHNSIAKIADFYNVSWTTIANRLKAAHVYDPNNR
jgi:hypothetical protein